MKGRLTLLAAGATVLGVGCDITLPGSGGGGDAEADATSDSGSETVGDQCTTIVTEFCAQVTGRCFVAGVTLSDCLSNDMPMCCTGTACNATSTSSAATVATCTSAIDAEDCSSVVATGLPTECTGVPAP
ncbi:MAG: hypothetical protein ACLP1X_31555 [Polyangiaceae bacterium]|jgi:hypothetical protein